MQVVIPNEHKASIIAFCQKNNIGMSFYATHITVNEVSESQAERLTAMLRALK